MIQKDIKERIHSQNDGRKNKSPSREKIGFIIICIGKKGVGKSTTVREVLKGIRNVNPNKDFYICDPNSEFLDFDNIDGYVFNPDDDDTFTNYINLVKDKKRSVIFVEEATIFLDPRKREGIMVDKMVKARHDENIIIMNFHSWRSVPAYIFDMIDFVFIHKTNDTDSKVKLKCDMPHVMEAYTLVQKHESKYFKKLIDLSK